MIEIVLVALVIILTACIVLMANAILVSKEKEIKNYRELVDEFQKSTKEMTEKVMAFYGKAFDRYKDGEMESFIAAQTSPLPVEHEEEEDELLKNSRPVGDLEKPGGKK